MARLLKIGLIVLVAFGTYNLVLKDLFFEAKEKVIEVTNPKQARESIIKSLESNLEELGKIIEQTKTSTDQASKQEVVVLQQTLINKEQELVNESKDLLLNLSELNSKDSPTQGIISQTLDKIFPDNQTKNCPSPTHNP